MAEMINANRLPDRFYSLDALRGLAALSVVVWHWQHFFFKGAALPATFQRAQQPFYAILAPLYEAGWYGVDFFFTLSGFIFFWLYRQRIEERQIDGASFFSLRISRLYPLHLATFVSVAILQFFFWRQNGTFFVYQMNDIYHAVLNLLFVAGWGLERGYSFNAPIWSVSVEIFLYTVFFACARFIHLTLLRTLLMALIGYGVSFYVPNIGRGMTGFFMGGATFWLLAWILRNKSAIVAFRYAFVATILLWALTFAGLALKPGLDLPFLSGLLFPATILTFALAEVQRHSLGKKFAFLGDASYAIYLLHFPLQLICLMTAIALGSGSQLFMSRWVFGGFMLVLIAASLSAHRSFERPTMIYLRSRLVSVFRGPATRAAG